MRKAVSITTVTLLLFVLIKLHANAETSVKIESNDGSAKATVKIKNSFNSSYTSSNTVEAHTKVRIETNGEVKEYESTNGEDVNITSNDGTSKVTITNKTNGSPIPPHDEPNPTITDIQDEIDDATGEARKKAESVKEKQKDFFKRLEELIKNFLSNLF